MTPPRPDRARRRTLRAAWTHEVEAARTARRTNDPEREWAHLERAHIVSQPLTLTHTGTHVLMLVHGLRHRSTREISGQLFRILVAAPGSISRRYPVGNTGAAGVNPYLPMPIPADLRAVLGDDQADDDVRPNHSEVMQ